MPIAERKMRTRLSKKKNSAAGRLSSPMPEPATTPTTPRDSLSESPKDFDFNFNTTKLTSSASTKKKNTRGGVSASRTTMKPTGNSMSPSLKSISSVADLKEMASSRLDSIKRQLERSQSEICKDLEASESRLQKRLKIQTQSYQQILDEAEREYKKLSTEISEGQDAMKASYAEFMAEAQSSAARLCKTSIPAISESVEKALSSLSSRYGVSSTSVR